MTLGFLTSDDIFISYSRWDASTYAPGLADKLIEKGFSCFIDRYGAEPGRDLPDSLKKKIRSCKMFVLVASERAATSESIEKEIKEFLQTGRASRILPVDIDGSLMRARWYSLVDGIAPEAEKNADALDDGNPSPSVISRVEKSFKYVKGKDKLRRATAGAALLLLALLALSVWATVNAAEQLEAAALAMMDAEFAKGEADTAKAEALVAQFEAEKAKSEAVIAKGEAETAELDAAEQKRLAGIAANEAAEKTRLAKEAGRKAQAAEISRRAAQTEADRQQTIADSRSLANRSQTLLSREPDETARAISLASDALKKYHTAEADTALRESLAQTPRLHDSKIYTGDIEKSALSPDGRHFATLDIKGTLRVYETGMLTPFKVILGEGLRVALSLNAAHAAVVTEREIRVYDLANGRSHVIACEPGDAVEKIAISPDGKYLAVVHGPLKNYYYNYQRTAVNDRSVRVQDAATGEVIKSFDQESDMQISDIAFGPVGDLAVAGQSKDATTHRSTGHVIIWPLARLWTYVDTAESALNRGRRAVPGVRLSADDFLRRVDFDLDANITAIALSQDDMFFATDRAVWKRTRNYQLGAVVRVTFSPNSLPRVEHLAFNGEGTQLAVVRVRRFGRTIDQHVPADRGVEVWDVVGLAEAATTSNKLGTGMIEGLAFKPGGDEVAAVTASNDERPMRLFRSVDGAEVEDAKLRTAPEDGWRIFVDSDAGHVITVGDSAAHVLDVWGGRKIPVPFGDDLREVRAAALSRDGKVLALAGQLRADGTTATLVYRARGDSYEKPKPLALENAPTFMTLTQDGQLLATQQDNDVRVWDVRSGRDVTPRGLRQLGGIIRLPRFSPGGRFIAVVWTEDSPAANVKVRVWRTEGGTELDMPGYLSVHQYVFSPDERHLLLIGIEYPPVEPGKPLPPEVRNLSTSVAQLLDLSTGRVVKQFDETNPDHAAFSPDGCYIGFGTPQDGFVHVYGTDDLETEVARLYQSSIYRIAFSDDSRYVAASSYHFEIEGLSGDRQPPIRVWLLRPEELRAEASSRLRSKPAYAR